MANKSVQQDRYRLSGTYERLRRSLLDLPSDGRLEKPLAYWVQPTDKRLPIAFLDVPLRDLVARPLEDLMSTPGVGHKKILGFFDLLRRATKTNSLGFSFGMMPEPSPHDTSESKDVLFDPTSVSEAVWATWCETVDRCGFRDEALGRLAPTLQTLPTVIWRVPLGRYADRSLFEIRKLKTHGSKRVGAILEVFRTVHEAASVAVLPEAIDLCLAPRFIGPVTKWLLFAAGKPSEATPTSIRQRLIDPLIQQTKIDLGNTVAGLLADRLTGEQNAPTVKQQADALGVTRARVYQLIEDCAEAMDVRWAEGRWLIPSVASRVSRVDRDAAALIRAAGNLYFPTERQNTHATQSLSFAEGG